MIFDPARDDDKLHVLETLADRHKMVPLASEAFGNRSVIIQLGQRLSRGPVSNHPWLPLGTLGPLLVMGHYNPACMDFMSVADPFRVEVVIDADAYDQHYLGLFRAWDWKALADRPPLKLEGRPAAGASVEEVLVWFGENYPLDAAEKESLMRRLGPVLESGNLRRDDIDRAIPQLGIALEWIRNRSLVFNPMLAPGIGHGVEEEGLRLLERYHAYPLLESSRVRYWLCDETVRLGELERQWSDLRHAVPNTVVVLGDRQTIGKRLSLERSRLCGV